LAKIDGVSYNTEWVTPQDDSAVWGQITGDLSDQGDLQGALDAKLDVSTAASTYYLQTNPLGFITASALAPYLPLAGGYITGDIQSVNGSGYRTFDGGSLTAVLIPSYLQFGNSVGSLTLDAGGITFNSSPFKQTVPFLGLDGYATEDWVNSQLGSYLTISSASATYYPLTNPAGYITLSALSGYATESWVTSQGYLTSAALVGYATESWVGLNYYPLSNPSGYISDAPSDGTTYGRRDGAWEVVGGGGLITSVTYPLAVNSGDLSIDLVGYATESWVQSQGYLTSVPPPNLGYLTGDISWDTYANTGRLLIAGGNSPDGMFFSARLNFGDFTPNQPETGDFWRASNKFQYSAGGVQTIASESWVTGLGYATTGQLSAYAPLAGATFTGKVNLATLGTATPSINLGGQCDPAPASAANGDIWISNAVSPKLTYRMGGVNYNLPVLNQFNTFTNNMVIDMSSSTAALRVTQRGAGNAIEVEDSTTPDATKFVVDQFGKVGVGTAPDATAAIKIDGNGMSFNGLVFNPTATAAHTGGHETLDLLVTINGTNYRLGLRPA
jgi:hypothetical protein